MISTARLLRNDFQLALPQKHLQNAEWHWNCVRRESMYALDLNTLPASDLGNTGQYDHWKVVL
jgi:hypothetical protein